MDLNLNDAQLLVLQWVADGADIKNPPSETFKTSAPPLHARGLVILDKRRGHWNITITEAGRFYLKHGHHPKARTPMPPVRGPSSPTPGQETAAPDASTPKQEAAAAPQAPARSKRVAKDKTVPVPEQVRRPHKAVKELVDHKARLDVPVEQRQRALLILHALAQEAVRRGWDVIAYPSTFKRDEWNGRRTRLSPGPDLFSIDAGDAPVAIRVRMLRKRVPHVPTEKELAEKAKYSWTRIPTHDYLPTEGMRLEIRSSAYGVLNVDDTGNTRIEDKLLRAIERIEGLSIKAREAAELRRQIELQRQEAQRRADELRRRASRYGSWLETLEHLRDDVIRHRELAEVVAGLREAVAQRGPDHEHVELLGEYLAWSEAHLAESDPFRRIRLPQGDRPDLSFDDWRQWKRQHPHT